MYEEAMKREERWLSKLIYSHESKQHHSAVGMALLDILFIHAPSVQGIIYNVISYFSSIVVVKFDCKDVRWRRGGQEGGVDRKVVDYVSFIWIS